MSRTVSVLLVAFAALLPACGDAHDPTGPSGRRSGATAPVVPSFERFHREGDDLVEAGLLLLDELRCVACHAHEGMKARPARTLRDLHERVSPGFLREFLTDTSGTHPGTTMPTIPLTAEEVDSIVATLTPAARAFARQPADEVAAARGEALYHSINCAACHAPQNGAAAAHSVPLPDPGRKWSYRGLRRFIERHANLRGRESGDITHYLLRDVRVPGALKVTHWHDWVESLDDTKRRKAPRRTSQAEAFDLTLAQRDRGYVLRFDGWLRIDRTGPYAFRLRSDDGSRLWIDGEVVVDNDRGRKRGLFTKDGTVHLAKGERAIRVEYFQRDKEQTLEVTWEGPGIPRGPIPAARLSAHRGGPRVVDAPRDLAPADPTLLVRHRCDACHEIPRSALDAAPSPAPRLTALRPDRGCLGGDGGPWPNHALDGLQRSALRLAIAALRDGQVPAADAAVRVRRTLERKNCLACHERDGVGGVPEDRDDLFTSTAHNQGDEGRIPPHLNGVGRKLRRGWLEKVLIESPSPRPHFATRMPRFFDDDAMRQLAADLAELDRRTPDPAAPSATQETKDAGHALVGAEGGLNCISCHHFNGREAAVMQMIDLTTMTERLHRDWFKEFMRDPGRINRGTRMPQFTPLPKLLDADIDRQIDAIWDYLADGRTARTPKGLDRKSVELVVGGETIIYRGKFREVGFRGIAVGHPELTHVLFGAENGRLALLWKDRFLNVAAHWRIQSMGRIGPRGHSVIRLPPGPSFAHLPADGMPWPDEDPRPRDYRFGGYRVDGLGRPTFRYTVAGVEVEDSTRGLKPQSVLERRLVVRGSRDRVFLRVAVADEIGSDGAGGWVADELTIRFRGEATPQVRTIRGKQELVAPVVFTDGTAEIVLEYEW